MHRAIRYNRTSLCFYQPPRSSCNLPLTKKRVIVAVLLSLVGPAHFGVATRHAKMCRSDLCLAVPQFTKISVDIYVQLSTDSHEMQCTSCAHTCDWSMETLSIAWLLSFCWTEVCRKQYSRVKYRVESPKNSVKRFYCFKWFSRSWWVPEKVPINRTPGRG